MPTASSPFLEVTPSELLFVTPPNEPCTQWLTVKNTSPLQKLIGLRCLDPRLAIRPFGAILKPNSSTRFSLTLAPLGCSAVQAQTDKLINNPTFAKQIEVCSVSRASGQANIFAPSNPWTPIVGVAYQIQALPTKESGRVHTATGLYVSPPEQLTFSPPYDGYSTAYLYLHNPTTHPLVWNLACSAPIWFKHQGDASLAFQCGRLRPGETAFRYIDFKGLPRHFRETGGTFDREKALFRLSAAPDAGPETSPRTNGQVREKAQTLSDSGSINLGSSFAEAKVLQAMPQGKANSEKFVFRGKKRVFRWCHLV